MTGNRCRSCSPYGQDRPFGRLFAGDPGCLLSSSCLGRGFPQAATVGLSPQGVAGYQTTDKLLLTIGLANPERLPLQGKLQVELVEAGGKIMARDEKAVDQKDPVASYRFEFANPTTEKGTGTSKTRSQSPFLVDKLTLRCRLGQQKFETPLRNILVVKAHETSLATSQEFFAGSTAAIRCDVHGVKSIAENIPLAGAKVEIQLRAKDGKVTPLLTDKTGADGIAQSQFKVPALPAGQYTLEVATHSDLGEEKLEREVRVKADPKVLLVTDKPLYQPGQEMHIRALALQAFDLTPVGGKDLVFEVEDAKGNKVFKRTVPTSEYGIAAIDFQLADEVNMGDYQVRALLGEQQASKTVTVKRYVLPKFKVELKADKSYYMPKETVQGDLQINYFHGKPVTRG